MEDQMTAQPTDKLSCQSRAFSDIQASKLVRYQPVLHAVSRVTSGRRYAFLPFPKIREANNKILGAGVGALRNKLRCGLRSEFSVRILHEICRKIPIQGRDLRYIRDY